MQELQLDMCTGFSLLPDGSPIDYPLGNPLGPVEDPVKCVEDAGLTSACQARDDRDVACCVKRERELPVSPVRTEVVQPKTGQDHFGPSGLSWSSIASLMRSRTRGRSMSIWSS